MSSERIEDPPWPLTVVSMSWRSSVLTSCSSVFGGYPVEYSVPSCSVTSIVLSFVLMSTDLIWLAL